MLFVAIVMAGCVVGGVMWLAKKRWEPALNNLTTMVEREMRRAEQSAQALQAGMHAQAQRAQRQSASVHEAIAGVRALHNITEDLDQCATDLKHLAQLMSSDASSRRAAPAIAEHVVTSAKQIAITADQARQTYRRLQTSVNQLVAEATSMQDFGEEAEQHARDLTGMMERLRQGIQPRSAKGAQRPTKLPDAEPPRREPAPRPVKLPDAERPRHEAVPAYRPPRREPPPPPDWSEEAPVAPPPREPRRAPAASRYLDDPPPVRHPTRQRPPEEEREDRRPTRRREEDIPPPRHPSRHAEREDPRYRHLPEEDASGWLADQDRPAPSDHSSLRSYAKENARWRE